MTVGQGRPVEEFSQHIGVEVEWTGLTFLLVNPGQRKPGGERTGADADGGGGLGEVGGKLKPGAGRADGSANQDADQVCPAHGTVALVGKISVHLVGACDLVVDLRQRGVHLE